MNPNPSSCAAQYVRMSTDQQDLSIGIQKEAIAAYAAANGLSIVASYEDAGRSGLRIKNRHGMQRLVLDVEDPRCPFRTVLVYDVSRWGRFQNIDASAYYDYHCRLHGVTVVYIAESFEREAGPISGMFKSMKRSMAAEDSRERGVKTRGGQIQVIRQGYSAGGAPAIGLSRLAVMRDGTPRMVLAPGERKGVQSDRVRLVPGPPEEVALLQRIFDLYAHTPITMRGIAQLMKVEEHRTRAGGLLTEHIIADLLGYEPFIGHYVWGRRVNTPGGVRLASPDDLFRADNSIEPLIDLETWKRVQDKRRRRTGIRCSPEQLLGDLQQALRRNPDLTSAELRRHGCAAPEAYANAFGSVGAAFAIAGRDEAVVLRSSRARERRSKEMLKALQQAAASHLSRSGFAVHCHQGTLVITIEEQVRLQVYLSQRRSHTREPSWYVQRLRQSRTDFRLLVFVDEFDAVVEVLLVPEALRPSFPMLVRADRFAEFAEHRLESLEDLAARLGLAAFASRSPAVPLPHQRRRQPMEPDHRRARERQAWMEYLAWCRQNPAPAWAVMAERFEWLVREGNFYAARLKAKRGIQPRADAEETRS